MSELLLNTARQTLLLELQEASRLRFGRYLPTLSADRRAVPS